MEHFYFDNAATTPMDPTVIAEMTDQMTKNFGNASSTHYFGRESRDVVDRARRIIAKSLNAAEDEILFTSGGTESNNTAIFGTAKAKAEIGKHIITTKVEHPSVLNPMKELAATGFEITYLDVNEDGLIDLNQLKSAIRPDTILVSIMAVNNEVGSIMPLQEIGEIVAPTNAYFHVDNVQGYGNLDVDVNQMQIDLLSTSAHKINGPKFLGFLYKRNTVKIPNLLFGGEQERKQRPGTENVPAIAGFGQAVAELSKQSRGDIQAHYKLLQETIVKGLTDNGIEFEINGAIDDQHSHHVLNLWFKDVSTYVLQTNLDLAGFAVSGGSACTAGSLEPSHVLTAMFGENSPRISESIRISFGRFNTIEEAENLTTSLVKILGRLQKIQTKSK